MPPKPLRSSVFRQKIIDIQHTREGVTSVGNEFSTLLTLTRNAGVEILDSFSEPHSEDEERSESLTACKSIKHAGDSRRNFKVPMINPKNPIHADKRCSMGFSNIVEILDPILSRKEIKVNVMRNNAEKEIATAMNAGVAAVGAESRRFGEFAGSVERSEIQTRFLIKLSRISIFNLPYCGDRVGAVQFTGALFFEREHEPG